MKSTGEVIGRDITLQKALYKALVAAGYRIKEFGTVLFTVADREKKEALDLAKRFSAIGYSIIATEGTQKYLEENGVYALKVNKINEEGRTVIDVIRKREADFVINSFTESRKDRISDGFLIRRESVENNIPCLTSLDTVSALLEVLESLSFSVNAYTEK